MDELSPIDIVLIDDEPSVLAALKLVLEAIGFAVKDFNYPMQALDFLRAGNHCEFLICDLKMPVLNGLQVLEQSKIIDNSIKFILMSGHADSSDVANAKRLGAAAFLAKPFAPDQLREAINGARASTQRAANSSH